MPSRRSLDSSPFDRVTILIWRCYWQVRLSSRSFSADGSHGASCMRSRNAWLKPAISYRQLTNWFDKEMAIRTYIHTAAILPTAHGSVDPTGLCASMGLPRSRPGPHCLSKTGSREAKPGTSVLHIQLPLFLVFRSAYSGNFKVTTTWVFLGLSGPLWASLGLSDPL